MSNLLNIAALFPKQQPAPPAVDHLLEGCPYELTVNGETVEAWFTRESDDSGCKPWDELQKVMYKGVDVSDLLTRDQIYELQDQLDQLRLREKDEARATHVWENPL